MEKKCTHCNKKFELGHRDTDTGKFFYNNCKDKQREGKRKTDVEFCPGETCTWLVIPAVQTDLVPIQVDHQNIRRWFPAYKQSISQKSFMKIAEDALPKTGLSKFI